jgi:hypothetical protein
MTEEFKVQITLNAPPPAQYAKGAMANFRGETVDEVRGQLEAAKDVGLLELAAEVEAIWLANASLGATTVASEPAETQGEGGAVATLHVCTHGKRDRKEGTRKDGSKWVGYFCPEKSKRDQCDVEWAK